MLLPLDILVALKYVLVAGAPYSYEQLERETGISSSSIHRSTKRLHQARLVMDGKRVHYRALEELLFYGVPYVYFAKQGEQTRGHPTAWAASPLNRDIVSNALPPVWPDPFGEVRGFAVTPLHKAVPQAALKDSQLYELLALVDAFRIGTVRERKLAREYITHAFTRSGAELAVSDRG